MSTHEDKTAATTGWPRHNAPPLDVTGMGLAGDQPFDLETAEQMVGKMLANPKAVGKVVGVRGFRDGPQTFYGLQVMWTRTKPTVGTQHTTVFSQDLAAETIRQLHGRESSLAKRQWTTHVVTNDLSHAKHADQSMKM